MAGCLEKGGRTPHLSWDSLRRSCALLSAISDAPLAPATSADLTIQKGTPAMTYVVTDACIRCKYQDCVEVCPVDCFYEGENMLVIHPDECIDCGVCEPECPAEAILPDVEAAAARWIDFNRQYAEAWPVILQKGDPPEDADAWKGVPDKMAHFSETPGQGS